MYPSPVSCYFFPLRSNYYPQHPVLKHPQSIFFPSLYTYVANFCKPADVFVSRAILLIVPFHAELLAKQTYSSLSIIHINKGFPILKGYK
jgi:hypothetical protein